MNPQRAIHSRLFGVLRELFCDHAESFAYRKYGDFAFVEICSCSRCGKTLKHFDGFDEDMRG
jgi:hypothetical protein